MGKKGEEQGRLFTYFQLNWAWNLGAVLTANGSLRRRHTCSSGQGCCPGCDPTFGPSAPDLCPRLPKASQRPHLFVNTTAKKKHPKYYYF